MKGYKLVVIVVLLVVIAVLSYYKYFTIVKEKDVLVRTVEEVNLKVARLETEKLAITDELQKEKERQGQIVQEKEILEAELQSARNRIEQLSKIEEQIPPLQKMIDDLKKGNLVLQKDKEVLAKQMEQISQEKTALEAKLRSLEELKKAIRELKAQLWREKVEKWHQEDTLTSIAGNRGYILKNGMTTYHPKVKIEVITAP